MERRARHERQSSVCAHHTPATGRRGDESHREPIKCVSHSHTPATGGEEREDIEANSSVLRSPQTSLQVERSERHRSQSSVTRLTPTTSYRWRGERDIEPIKCTRSPPHQLQVERRERHRDNQVYALTTHQLQVERRERHRDNQVYALTTHQLQVERRESS